MYNPPATDFILKEVKAEFVSATDKFDQFKTWHEGYAVILEELDELWDAIKNNESPERKKEEAIQVAAMALRFIHDLCEKE